MIDAITIFTKGGVVLWSYYYIKLKSNPIDKLIKTVLLEERAGQQQANLDSVNLQWRFVNHLDLVFVVAYKGFQSVTYIESLLNNVSIDFLNFIGNPTSPSSLFNFGGNVIKFDSQFFKTLNRSDQEQQKCLKNSQNYQAPSRTGVLHNPSSSDRRQLLPNSADTNGAEDGHTASARKLEGMSQKAEGGASRTSASSSTKEKTVWQSQKVTRKAMQALDFSTKSAAEGSGGIDTAPVNTAGAAALVYGADEEFEDTDEDSSDESDASGIGDEEEGSDAANDSSSGGGGWTARGIFSTLASSIKRATGNAELTKEELDAALKSFGENLLAKNVATDITTQLVDSVKASLEGLTTARWTSVHSTVKTELTNVVERILTPKRSVDVLRSALEAKARGHVYSICFLGVNGVGKSTNLAKVCYFLKQKGGLKVMIAACDTFRAGAVEQLRTHARCLDVHLFEQGYGKDPAMISKQALQYARTNGFDVVLIDTAGRMQDNEPLMRALAKLVAVNNPDLILFVGEALVGNDAIDQLVKFNQCLTDFAPTTIRSSERRTVDGVLLTKFDTVDDKVGAALSMVYQTGQPIVFVGTGQKYTHLRKLNVNTAVKALLG